MSGLTPVNDWASIEEKREPGDDGYRVRMVCRCGVDGGRWLTDRDEAVSLADRHAAKAHR